MSNACGIFQRILAPDEYEEAREKIDIYARLDRLGRAVANAIQVVTVAESQAMRRVIRQQGGGWPKVPGLPLLSNGLQMRKGLIDFITEQYHSHGLVFETEVFKRKFLIMAGPEANLFLLREGKDHFRSRDQWLAFNRELGAARGLASMDGADHYQLRAGMRASYSRSLMENRCRILGSLLLRRILLDISGARAAGYGGPLAGNRLANPLSPEVPAGLRRRDAGVAGNLSNRRPLHLYRAYSQRPAHPPERPGQRAGAPGCSNLRAPAPMPPGLTPSMNYRNGLPGRHKTIGWLA